MASRCGVGVRGDGDAAGLEVDLDGGDAGDGRDLLGDGGDAVAAGHALHGPDGGAHVGSPRCVVRVWSGDQERTSRAMAAEASASFSSASASSARGGVAHAVVEVVVEQQQRDVLQRAGRGRDLGQDVDAVRVLVDHARDAAHLALDLAQAREDDVLVSGVSVGHGFLQVVMGSAIATRVPPWGIPVTGSGA